MTIRTVDSWMQLVDRLIVCRLKEYHYYRDGRAEQAGVAKGHAEELSEVATCYMEECLSGDREPRVHRHLRYHQHEAEEIQVSSVMEAVSQLAACHAEYWQHQGEVMRLREMAREMMEKAPELMPGLYEALNREQLVLDGCNQRRSELVHKGDDLLLRTWEKRKQERRP